MSGCIQCGKCLEVCPLLRATGREELSPRAKATLCELIAEGAEGISEKKAADLAALCLGCGRCRAVCTQSVDVPRAVAELRAAHPGWREWVYGRWMKNAPALWPRASAAARFVPGHMSGALRSLARTPVEPFVEIAEFPDGHRGTEALLFEGCAARFAQPHWTSTAKALLDGLGVSVVEAEFACCGQPLASVGLADERLDAGRRNVDIWRASGNLSVIGFCASCMEGLRAYGVSGLRDEIFVDEDEADAWLQSLSSLSGFLKSARFVVSENAPCEVAWHRPCHGRDDGRDHGRDCEDPDIALAESALGDRLAPAPDVCCGFGGILRLAVPGLANAVARERSCTLAGAPLVLTGCTACVFQLDQAAKGTARAAHWMEMLR